jgi:hypothetical protein
MIPIIAALAASPAVQAAAQQAIRELTPAVRHGLKALRPGFLAPVVAPSLLVSCFAAGVAVGWFTAPRRGAVMRRKVRDTVSKAATTVGERAKLQRENLLAWAKAQSGTSPSIVESTETH